MNYASLFSGIGGLDLGFDRAGLTPVLQVELDPQARAVLARHWPAVRRMEDVRDVTADELVGVDVLCGGFPCQDVSVAGQRAGLAGERSGLWHEFRRLLDVGRPAWVVIENVPGLLSSNGGRDFGVIVSGLVELGYGVCWRVLDSQHFGVPQRRRRVFIIGHLGDDRAGQILLNADSGAWDSAPRRAAGEVAPTLAASGAGTSRVGGQSAEGNFYVPGRWWDGGDLADTLDVSMLVKGQMMPEKRRFPVVMESWQPVVFAADCEGYPDSDLIYCPLCGEEYADCVHPGPTMDGYEYKEFDGVLFARPAHAPPLVSFDWQAGGGGPADQSFRGKGRSYIVRGGDYAQLRANAHDAIAGSSVRPRRLTPVECERLQGFPDGWTAGHADTPRYRMLGNAVTVNVAEWIGRRLLAAE